MLAGVTLGSGVAILDGSVVNVALRTIGRDLGASLAQLQWVVNGYLLALASLVLVGGALGDRFGRRRVYLVGVVLVPRRVRPVRRRPDARPAHRPARVPGRRRRAAHPRRAGAHPGVVPPTRTAPPAIGTWAGLVGRRGGDRAGARRLARRQRLVAVDLRDQRAAVRRGRRAHQVRRTREPRPHRHRSLRRARRGAHRGGPRCRDLRPDRLGRGRGAPSSRWRGWWRWAPGWRSWSSRSARHPRWFRWGCSRSRIFSAANAMTLLVYGALGRRLALHGAPAAGGGLERAAGRVVGDAGHARRCCCSRRAPPSLSARIGPRIPMTVGPAGLRGGGAAPARRRRGRDVVVGAARA